MNLNYKVKNKPLSEIINIFHSLVPVLKSRYLYIAILVFIAGAGLNIASQTYLHNYVSEGKKLPIISDLILDNLPVLNVSLYYDLFALIPIILVLIYIVHKKDYDRIPFILLMSGLLYCKRHIYCVDAIWKPANV